MSPHGITHITLLSMSHLIFISRNFTELGGFQSSEIIDFYKRNILTEKDFVRLDGGETWIPLHAWISGAQDAVPIKELSSVAGRVTAKRNASVKVNGAAPKKTTVN
ncbi:hypothetical protein [Verrucomicrobium spinosum]|nr:hypothetical protein [Verrucomicrobium spinosum]